MKYFFILLLSINIFNYSCAQKIIAVTFVDTDDDKIGDGCTIDLKNFRKYCNRLKNAIGYTLEEHNYSGADFSSINFDSFENNFQSSSNDIIFLYVSSHGARSNYDRTIFPQVYVKGQLKSVYDKYMALYKKPHKTLVTIIDACNVIRGITPKEIELFSKTYQPDFISTISEVEKANSKKVFVDNSFDLIITSSQVGITSLSTPGGSVFTNNFIASCNYYLRNENRNLVNIDNILERAKDYTYNETQRMYINNHEPQTNEHRPHYPLWSFNRRPSLIFTKDFTPSQFNIEYTVQKLSRQEKRHYHTRDDYRIVMNIKGDQSIIDSIKEVKYILHHTFRHPVVIATDKENDYKYVLFVWGEFLLRAEITLKNESVIDVAKDLKLQ